ncbi:hypothetical protein M0812_12084 [Anaeramoeba flamelloides]|uniref:VWFA domain-containing protein n=1 Tax=Anaeramoeba flamelloides TaxID=1746091 RepID=A0AAV7ZPM3_9EUKA|nr:hypothetical protein M0812_12084 [Anaeramoeba flamelloides]
MTTQLGIIIDNYDGSTLNNQELDFSEIQIDVVQSYCRLVTQDNKSTNFAIIPTSSSQDKIELYDSQHNENKNRTPCQYLNDLKFCKRRNLVSSVKLAISKLNNEKIIDKFEDSLTEQKESDLDLDKSQHLSYASSDSDFSAFGQFQNPSESETINSSKSNVESANEKINEKEIEDKKLLNSDRNVIQQKRIVVFLTTSLNLNSTQTMRLNNLIKSTNILFDFVFLQSAFGDENSFKRKLSANESVKNHILEINSEESTKNIFDKSGLFDLLTARTSLKKNNKENGKSNENIEKSEEVEKSSYENFQEQTQNNNENEQDENTDEVFIKELEGIEDEMIRTAMLLSMAQDNQSNLENVDEDENGNITEQDKPIQNIVNQYQTGTNTFTESESESDSESELESGSGYGSENEKKTETEMEMESNEENEARILFGDNSTNGFETQMQTLPEDNSREYENENEIEFRFEDFDFSLLGTNNRNQRKRKKYSKGQEKKIDYSELSEEEQLKIVMEMSLKQLNEDEKVLIKPTPKKFVDPEITTCYNDKQFMESLIFQLPGVDPNSIDFQSILDEGNSMKFDEN